MRGKADMRSVESNGFLNPVIVQCDKKSVIDVCRKLARERKARTVLRVAPKQVIRAIGLSKQYTDTYRHWHGATRHKLRRTQAYSDSNFTFHPICSSLLWICAIKIHSATRRQNAIPVFAWISLCFTFVHVRRMGVCIDPCPRSSQVDESMD